MATTAVQDRSLITLALAKAHSRITTNAEDGILQILLDAAKSDADAYMGNDFLDEDGVTELPIPPYVERWILKEFDRDFQNRPNGITKESLQGAFNGIMWADRDLKGLFRGWKPRV